MNGEQSHDTKKFCRAFTKYGQLLCDLDVSSIYPSASRCVSPPESGENAHVTHGIMGDLGGPMLNLPRLGFSNVLPRLWDPGELTLHLMSLGCFQLTWSICYLCYPYAPCMCNLVEIPSLQLGQDFHTSHMEPNILSPMITTESITAITKNTVTINMDLVELIRREIYTSMT